MQVFRYIGIVSLTICKHPLDYSGNTINIPLLYIQGLLLGFGASMTLVSGSMATLLDGDLKEAAQRSQTMHTIRNFSAAMLIPIIAYTIKNHIQKEHSLYMLKTLLIK